MAVFVLFWWGGWLACVWADDGLTPSDVTSPKAYYIYIIHEYFHIYVITFSHFCPAHTFVCDTDIFF